MIQTHLLDVGKTKYGDSILLQLGDRTILVDGGNPGSFYSSHLHDSIPKQLEAILGPPPFHLSLLVVTHAHNDHIGCLPKMVKEGMLTAEWALVADLDLGWGIAVDSDPVDAGADPQTKAMLAALREEPMVDVPDDLLAEFLIDAQTLQERYAQMLEDLAAAGTNVVNYLAGEEVDALLEEFADLNMEILGPNRLMLLKCAARVEGLGHDFLLRASDLMRADSMLSDVELYRQLLTSTDNAALDASRMGAALNCMSIVLLFEIAGVRLLLTGDMQFVDPEMTEIDSEMAELRQLISERAPYDLYKIGHHGSHNSFNGTILQELAGTVNFAISTGRESGRHPAQSVLTLLKNNTDNVFWVRTDRNGKCSFDFEEDPPTIEIDRGIFTDWRMNHVDIRTPPLPELSNTATGTSQRPKLVTPQPQLETKKVSAPREPTRDDVEVITRVPHRRTKVTVTIEVDPGTDDEDEAVPPPPDPVSAPATHRLPALAFVTDTAALASNIGAQAAETILEDLKQQGQLVIDVNGHGYDPQHAAGTVRTALAANSAVKGVVILGGYDVVPSEVLDVLPADLRQQVGHHTGELDDFIVWSDDLYGDTDGDTVAELPVSRIPDGRSAAMIKRALAAQPPQPVATKAGVRNVKRPFADGVFNILTGTGEMQSSEPLVHTHASQLSQHYVYLMLHGDYNDATEFHGEGTNGLPAIRLENIPDVTSSVVFCGCCWGALIVDTPALRALQHGATARTTADSIPLKFLNAGANAFVGCTGVHYSPVTEPYQFFGGPMHHAFWKHIAQGCPPAQALFNAKIDYISEMFHGRNDLIEQAIEFKILRQFTCLGLGW